MFKRLFLLAVLALSFAGAPAAAQTFDFSLTYTGLGAIEGGNNSNSGSVAARISFADGTFNTGTNSGSFSNLRVIVNGVETAFNVTSFSATLNSERSALVDFDLRGAFAGSETLEAASSFRAVFPRFDLNDDPSFQILAQTNSTPSGSATFQTSYTLGGSVISTLSGKVIGGNPTPVVSVPEINGGTVPLLAFILSVLAMMLYLRNTTVTRNFGFSEHRAFPAQST
jgi:hypothetical protein